MSDNLYQRNGFWYARVQVRGRDQRKSLQTKNRREAESRLKAFLATQTPYHGTVRKRFEDVTGEYLTDAETTLKPKTHKRYLGSILKLGEHFAGRWWDAITKEAVMQYISDRKREGVKVATIQRDLTALSQAAEYAVGMGWAGTNPVTLVPKRPLRAKRWIFKRPNDRSLRFGIANAYGNTKPLAQFLMATGMRLEEATTLERDQVDWRRRTATLTETKNGHARTVALSDEALVVLKAQPAYLDTALFFPSRDRRTGKTGPYKQASTNWSETQRRCIKLAAEANWNFQRFRLHDLRHIYAIDYLANGGNIYLLQQQLGHSTLRQTEEYLQFLSPEEQVTAKSAPAQIPSQPRRFSVAKEPDNG